MKLHDLFEQIETLEFSLRLSVLSGFKSVLLTLEHDETVQQLVDELQQSSESTQQVFQRLLDLLSRYDQPEYVQFSDEALTAYLYALNQVDSNLGQQAAERIRQIPGLWWARRLAEHLQIKVMSHSIDTKDAEADPLKFSEEEKIVSFEKFSSHMKLSAKEEKDGVHLSANASDRSTTVRQGAS